jgi:hypothetical protein
VRARESLLLVPEFLVEKSNFFCSPERGRIFVLMPVCDLFPFRASDKGQIGGCGS